MKLKTLLVVGSALGLSACISPYVGTPYDHAAGDVHAIGMANHAMPDKPIAWEVASVGSNFGLVGALVDAGIQTSRADAVNKALTNDGFSAETKLQERIASALDAEGYTVRPVDTGARPKREFIATYPAVSGEPVDAYLDVVVTSYGYLSAGAFQPFRPTLVAKVRLVSAKDTSKTLMENTIAYNAMAPISGVITLSPNPAYEFHGRSELLADPKRLEAGIDDAETQVAQTVARLLK